MMNLRRLFGAFLTFTMAATVSTPLTVDAAYTYSVKIVLGGAEKVEAQFMEDLSDSLTIISQTAYVSANEDDSITIEGLQYKDQISFNPQAAVCVEPDYYVKGMRLSGANEVVSKSAFDVVQDDTYVIAYGVGDVVPYVVKYEDENGNSLLEPVMYYGAENQELYIPYRYISGYTTTAYNIHVAKLVANEVFTFVYSKNQAGGTVYNTNRTTSYQTIQGNPTYTYQTVKRQSDEGIINNRGQEGNENNPSAIISQTEGTNEANDTEEVIQDEETPRGIQNVIDVPDDDVPEVIENKYFYELYKQYALLVLAIGIVVIVTTFILNQKEKNDFRRKN